MRSLKATILIFLLAVIVCQDALPEILEKKLFTKFQKFMEKHQKQYDNMDEFNKRFTIFKENYSKAKGQLKQDGEEQVEFSMGVTQFSDLTEEEFAQSYLVKDFDMSMLPEDAEPYKFEEGDEEDNNDDNNDVDDDDNSQSTNSTFLGGRNLQRTRGIPSSWDWRSHGAVTSVKNQGSCGGCWAFSAAGNIEGLYKRRYGKLKSLSPQQMIDCDNSNSGCNGGIMHNAFNYIRNTGGLSTWSKYPYRGYRGYCKNTSKLAKVRSYTSAGTNNEKSIKAMLYRTGPLSITVNSRSWQFYKGGVYNVKYSYCPYNPDHGVLLVGYGTTSSGIPYWTIKNSWGPGFGENGYIRIRRGTGLCGVNQYVYSAILA